MKHLRGLILLLIPIIVKSQNDFTATDQVKITGDVKSNITFYIAGYFYLVSWSKFVL